MLSLLLFLAKSFENQYLKVFNEIVREVLAKSVPIGLELLTGGKWVVRHSATQKGDYNIFFSDVDLALIVKKADQNDLFLEKVLSRYELLKKLFLFLGEIEVYSLEEWQEKKSLAQDNLALLKLSRSYRKMKWMKADFKKNKDSYHKAKAFRSFLRCAKEIKKGKNNFVGLLKEEFPYGVPFTSRLFLDFYSSSFDPARMQTKAQFQLLTAVNFKPFEISPKTTCRLRLPILQMELLEISAHKRFKQKKWKVEDEWFLQINQEITEIKLTCKDNFLQIPRRMALHLEDQSIQKEWFEEIKIEEEKIIAQKNILCSELDVKNWTETHLPGAKINLVPGRPFSLTRLEIYKVNLVPNTITFFGPTTERFGILNYARLIKYLSHNFKSKFDFEIVGFQNNKLTIAGMKTLISALHDVNTQLTVVPKPSGTIICPYRFNLKDERNWLKAANTFGLPVISSADVLEIVEKLEQSLNLT